MSLRPSQHGSTQGVPLPPVQCQLPLTADQDRNRIFAKKRLHPTDHAAAAAAAAHVVLLLLLLLLLMLLLPYSLLLLLAAASVTAPCVLAVCNGSVLPTSGGMLALLVGVALVLFVCTREPHDVHRIPYGARDPSATRSMAERRHLT
jgi:hypothetical protein